MRWLSILTLLIASSFVSLEKARAHGTLIEYKHIEAIEIQSRYDTGKPLANAQVTIYTPNNPTTPWQTGMTDETGQFRFTPDPNLTGYWEVKIRQGGHGGLVSIPVGIKRSTVHTNLSQTSSSLTSWQRGLMIGSVIWGCIGTALFFTKSQLPTGEASRHSQSSM